MIECVQGTVIDAPDYRVLERLRTRRGIEFDPEFLTHLPAIHGGVPTRQYFRSTLDVQHRLAFFLNFADDDTKLTPPRLTPKDYYSMDRRTTDRSIEYIIACEVDGFFNGQRIVPFGALFTPHRVTGLPSHPDADDNHVSLTPLDYVSCNAVCFDRSTNPHSIVVFDAERSGDEQERWHEGTEHAEIQYDLFTEPVADSFAAFAHMLSHSPYSP